MNFVGWIVTVLAFIGIVLLGLAYYVDKTGRSADESLGAVVPAIPGLFALALAVVILVIYGIFRLLRS